LGTNNPLPSRYFIAPSDTGRIVKDTFQQSVLQYLLQLSNNTDTNPYPNAETLAQGIMSASKAKLAVREIEKLGYVSHINHGWGGNEYIVHRDKIFHDLDKTYEKSKKDKQSVTVEPINKSQSNRLRSKYTKQQKAIMAEKTATEDVTIAHRAELKNGFKVIDENDKIVNNVVTDPKKNIKGLKQNGY